MAKTAKDIVIYVVIPAAEQYKIPVWKDVQIMMSFDWTSSKFELDESKKVFQNAVYTLRFNPLNRYLKPVLEQNLNYVQKGQTLILNTNKTTVNDLYSSQITSMLTYQYICPEELGPLCDNQFTN